MFFYSLLKSQKPQRSSSSTPTRRRNLSSDLSHSLPSTEQEPTEPYDANALLYQHNTKSNSGEIIGQSYSLTSATRHTNPAMLQYINGAKLTSVSRPKKSKAKKSKAKGGGKAKDEDLRTKKRPASISQMPRVFKASKTDAKEVTVVIKPKEEANVKRRKTGSHADAPIELTDSEDDTPLITRASRPVNTWSSDNIKGEVDTPAAVLVRGNEILLANYHKAQAELKDEKERVAKLQDRLESLEREYAIALSKVRQDMNQAVNEALAKAEVEQREKDLETVNERARLSTELIHARKERDELRRSLDASIETEKQKNATLNADLERESKNHAKTKHDLDAQLQSQSHLADKFTSLKAVNEYLQKDMEALKGEADKRLTLSPTPTPTSAEEMKVENVRKTYIKVKMRYDSLYSIAKHLLVSTQGMNLTNFGEFGGYLKQLRTAMDEVDQVGGSARDSQRSKDSAYADSTTSNP